MILYYAYDPMCSWCWAFRPVWQQVRSGLPQELPVKYVLGGLAADTDEPMSDEMQANIEATWRRIQQQVPGAEFNFDFWTQNKPRRSTYASCRAVISAGLQDPSFAPKMNLAIQKAYYLQARNPSNEDVLVQLAGESGLDVPRFSTDLSAGSTHEALRKQIDLCQSLDAYSFPSIVLKMKDDHRPIPLHYTDAGAQLNAILRLL